MKEAMWIIAVSAPVLFIGLVTWSILSDPDPRRL